MNIISEERAQILKEQNTAQEEFERLLENIPTDTKEIKITTPLYGELDLSVLEDKGYSRLEYLAFVVEGEDTGKITDVRNIPFTLKKLECSKQMIVGLELWLPKATEIILEHNYLDTLDMNSCVMLKKVVLNHNQLKEIKGLPQTLEEIYINHNQIKQLDLKNLNGLRVLHCVQNPGIILSNVPRTKLDLKMDENSNADIDFVEKGEDEAPPGTKKFDKLDKHNYKECLKEYFKLKTKYEKKAKDLRKTSFEKGKTLKQKKMLAREVIPPCVKCKRNVGTIFEQNDSRYVALCGSKNSPCELKIELFRGKYDSLDEFLELYNEGIENTKLDVIKQKLDVLFNYISEEASVKLFKQKLEDFNLDSTFHKSLMDKYNELHNSEYKKELRKQKIIQIHKLKNGMKELQEEYLKTQNRVILKEIMDIYVNEYSPEIHNLRQINYEVMEMNGLDEDNKEYQLFQMDAKLSQLEFSSGELPSVVYFRV